MRFALPIIAGAHWIVAWWLTAEQGYRPVRDAVVPWFTVVRADFVERALRLGGDGAALLPGLVFGDTSAVPETLAEAMRVSSLTHLMAVSGANCAIVTGIVFGLASIAGLSLAWRVGGAIAALVAFVALVGPEPSVLRASAMALIALGAVARGTPLGGVTVLSAAIIACLAVDPALSHSVGFALSVAATTGILLLARPLVDKLSRVAPKAVALLFAVPISASIACQPILFVLAPYVPTYGVFANAIAEPFVPVATVVGLLALCLTGVPWIGEGLVAVAWVFSSAVALVARFVAELPWARIPWPAGAIGFCLGAVISIGLSAWILGRVSSRWLAIPATACLVALSMTAGGTAVAWADAPRNWSWAQCDVGQGDAVVVRDGGDVALIDSGRNEVPLRECLRVLGIDHIDLAILTHFDIDHVGAASVIVGRVDTVLHGPTDGVNDDALLQSLRHGGANVVTAERGLTGTLGRLDWSIEWPTPTVPTEPGNPASVVVRFTASERCDATCVDGIDLGDLPATEQSRLRALGGAAPASVVKVSHHGSSDQDTPTYQSLRALVGLVGVGVNNEYGHPTSDALDLLASTGTRVFRSDTNGIVLVWRDADGTLRVWRERG